MEARPRRRRAARLRLHPRRGVRLDAARARGRPFRFRLARRGPVPGRQGRPRGGPVHAEPLPPGLDGREAPRDLPRRVGRAAAGARESGERLGHEPDLPRPPRPDRGAARRALRPGPAGPRVAGRQRAPGDARLQRVLARRLPGLARGPLRDDRPAQRGVGRRLLEPALRPLRAGRPPERRRRQRGRDEPPRGPRLPALYGRRHGRLPRPAGGHSPQARRAEAVDHDELHQRLGGRRRAAHPAARLPQLHDLPGGGRESPGRPELPLRKPHADGGGARLPPADRRGHRRHGAPAGPGQLGAGEPAPGPGRRPHVDPARARRRGLVRVHLSLPPPPLRQRALPRRHRGHRRGHAHPGRPGVRPGHRGREAPARRGNARRPAAAGPAGAAHGSRSGATT